LATQLIRFVRTHEFVRDGVLSGLLEIPVILGLAVEFSEVDIVGPQHTAILVDHGDPSHGSISNIVGEA
jgi:hypothetical protein